MKIRSKVVKSTINNKDILDTFQELLGTSDTNACLPVAHPKYVKLQTHVNRFIRLLSMFKDSSAISKFPDLREQCKEYIASLEKNFNESFTAPDLEQFCVKELDTPAGHNYNAVTDSVKIEFSKVFNNIKKCNVINIIIVTCKNLLQYKTFIEDKGHLNDTFLTKTAGNVISPLPDFPLMNFKKIYNNDSMSANDKSFVLMFISKLYEISYNTYQALSSPDVDVNEFVAIILHSIDQIKHHIPRCNEAFDKIVESVDILRNNFDGYYKDFLSSNNNASIIMENFVLDVSKHTKATPRITAQFRTIISHYRKMSSQQNADPRLKTLFKHVEKNFTELEKYQKEGEYQDTECETECSTTCEAECEAECETECDSNKSDCDNECNDTLEVQADAQADVQADVQANADIDIEVKPEVKPEVQTDVQAEVKSKTKLENVDE